ncbi:SDR family oxidoreductase, partial [Micromonospora aurantiaca]|nr:SDR family oxidoreductase [Micromonospora aurantiaca]
SLKHLPDRTGVIVNTASLSATQGNPYMTAYSASKGAVLAFSLSLAAELASRRIRVVPISPGSVDTPLIRSPHMFPPGIDLDYFSKIRSYYGAADPEMIAA